MPADAALEVYTSIRRALDIPEPPEPLEPPSGLPLPDALRADLRREGWSEYRIDYVIDRVPFDEDDHDELDWDRWADAADEAGRLVAQKKGQRLARLSRKGFRPRAIRALADALLPRPGGYMHEDHLFTGGLHRDEARRAYRIEAWRVASSRMGVCRPRLSRSRHGGYRVSKRRTAVSRRGPPSSSDDPPELAAPAGGSPRRAILLKAQEQAT